MGTVSVKSERGQLWWTPREQHALLNVIALIDLWSNLAFRAHRVRLIVLGVDKASDPQLEGEVSSQREIEFGVYMAPLDADPLVLDVDGAGDSSSFIRFHLRIVGDYSNVDRA